ncbi:3-hydroxyacyl-ACP dehydratase FabZ [Thioalbus denitrificans]|nr:3-hydroxyacyl-ACP dehydratase FabZ [Thioalbus denitrificans]
MTTMDVHEVLRHLPHRYPFLLVDRVIECTPGESLVAIKNVTINEPFFPGHFPHHPVMPGVLILEALAQACGLLTFRTMDVLPDDDTIFYFVGIDNARFKQPVMPGDQMRLEVKYVRSMRGVWKFTGEAKVDGKLAASADIMCAQREMKR